MRFTGLLMVLVCAAALFVPAQENTERVVQSKIIALEKGWNQAYKLADKRALDRIVDDQIVLINDDGSQQTKAADNRPRVPGCKGRSVVHNAANQRFEMDVHG